MSINPRKLAEVSFCIAILLLVVAALAIIPNPPQTYAGSCGELTDCPDINGTPDPDVKSLLHVTHREDAYTTPDYITPITTTYWVVTASYKSAASGVDCNCEVEQYNATFGVLYDSSTPKFAISDTNGNTTTYPFINVGLCDEYYCGSPAEHGYAYDIGVDLYHTVFINCPVDGPTRFYLDQVLYKTLAVYDGYSLGTTESCTTGVLLSPITQVFQKADNGLWTCNDNTCPTGVSLQLKFN